MICEKCGKELGDNDKFCGYCGYDSSIPKTPKETFCKNCNTVIVEGKKFCTNCGEKAYSSTDKCIEDIAITDDEKVKSLSSQTPNISKGKEVKKKCKVARLILISIIVLLLVSISGVAGFYIGKCGWEVIPFAKKTQFLPVAKLQKSDIVGDWIFQEKDKAVIIRYKADNTCNVIEGDGYIYNGTYEFDDYNVEDKFTMSINNYGESDCMEIEVLIIQDKLSINPGNAILTFTKVKQNETSIVGVWQSIDDQGVYAFTQEGNSIWKESLDSNAEMVNAKYLFDHLKGVIRFYDIIGLEDEDIYSIECRMEIIGDYILLNNRNNDFNMSRNIILKKVN